MSSSTAGLSDDERPVLVFHQHWKTVIAPLTVLVVTVAVLAALLLVLPASVPALVDLGLGVVALLVAVVFTGIPLLRWRTTVYELTNHRLRLREGILVRRGRDFPLARIADVSFEQSLADRMLRCGRLIVESPGEHGQLVLTQVPRVQQVQSTLFQLVEDESGAARPQQQPY